MSIAVVLVPDRGHIPRIGFEQQLRHRIETFRRLGANGADLLVRSLLDRELDFDDRSAIGALEIVSGHQSFSLALHMPHKPQMARWSIWG